jgi:2-polyprenyl-3-methyl-5-hydroxy-6-metoxy-1,4-benzoquinol methylase
MGVINRACPVCRQRETKILFEPKASPGPVAQCQNCSMIYVECIQDSHALIFNGPVIYDQIDGKILTSSNLEDVKNSWELKYISDKEKEAPFLHQNALIALEQIEKHAGDPRQSRQILDFGSGFGFFLATAKEQGWDAYGLEPLPATAVYARAKFGLNIITDTIHENSFPENFFDVVTSFQVFEHLPDPRENLKCLARILKEGGLILIEVPCVDTWTMPFLRSHHRHFVQDHLNFFSLKTLSDFLSNNGFEVVEYYRPKRIMSMQHLYGFWVSRKLPKPLSKVFEIILRDRKLMNRPVGISFRDILAVLARKR